MGRREQPGIIYRVVEGDTMFSSQLTQCEIQQLGVKTFGGGGWSPGSGGVGEEGRSSSQSGGETQGETEVNQGETQGDRSQREKMMGQKSSRKKP